MSIDTTQTVESHTDGDIDKVNDLEPKGTINSTAGNLLTSAKVMQLMLSLKARKYRHADDQENRNQVEQIENQLSLADHLTIFDDIEMPISTNSERPLHLIIRR